MKYLIITVIALASGFFAGYLLTRNSESTVTVRPQLPSNVAFPITPSIKPTDADATQLTYDHIDAQPTIFAKLKVAHDLADQSTIDELKTYILRAAPSRDPFFSYNLVSVFLEKLTSLDAMTAIEFVMANAALSNHQFIAHIVTSWVRHDAEAAIAYVEGLDNLSLQTALMNRLAIDPTIADTGILAGLVDSMGPSAFARQQMLQNNQLPPEQAFNEALDLTDQNRFRSVQFALIRWIREDPKAAIERIQLHANTEERFQMFQSVLHEFVRVDQEAAFEFAQQNSLGNIQLEQQLLSTLAQHDPKRTLPLVEAFVSRTGNAGPLNNIVSSWVKQNPSEALAYIETMDQQQRGNLYQSAAFSYVNSHPEEGFDWLLSLTDRYPQMVENTIGASINHLTIGVAERTIQQVSNEDIRRRLLIGIGNYKATQNSAEALDWLDGFKRDPAYGTAMQNVISNLSHQNPRQAADALETHLSEEFAAPLVGQIAANWYRASPRDSMAWLTSLPDGEAKLGALSTLVSSVAHNDEAAALEMIESLPEGKHRQEASRNLAYARIARAPEEVEDIIEDLSLSEQDATQLRAIAKQRAEITRGLRL